MSKGKSYIKRHMGVLFGMAILFVFQGSFLFLSQVELQDLAYLLILEILILAVLLGVDFLRYSKKVKLFEGLLLRPAGEQREKLEPEDILEEKYLEMIDAQIRSRMNTENEFLKNAKEMEQYYNIWVHQVKTPISGMNVVLQSMEPTEDVTELQTQLFSVEQYVDMALQYQRIKAKGNDLSFSEVSLNKVIRENIRKHARLFIGKRLAVTYQETSLKVLSDEKWLSFVLGQLFSNAIKYSTKGTIVIEACEDDDYTYLKVKDEGIGISPEDLSRVFERGYTGYNGRADKKSTGIGLFLCKNVMEMLGHKIEIESELGKGTEVVLKFSKHRITE